MAEIFKEAVVAAKQAKWGEVSGLAKKGVALQKGHMFDADFLATPLSEAVDKKDVNKTAELFANLVYLSIREKLYQNKKENFKNYKNAKARLQLARKSYMDVLDGNVRKRKAANSLAIMSQFNTALENIGNPGLFGVGKKAPQPSGYDQAVKKIEALIADSFPGFAK